jgi:hypothetical protein
MNQPGVGLDASWNAGLAMALHGGLQFGRQAIFSYGPLGFLQSPFVWYSDLALVAFLYSAALYVAFCTALAWGLRRLLPVLPTLIVAFFVVAVLPPLEQPLVVAVLVCLGVLEQDRSKRTLNLLVVGAASFASVESLVKLSTGPVIVVLLGITLIGARARWWRLLGFAALTAAELWLLWLATGQSPSAIPDFMQHTWQIASGYSEAMLRQVDVPGWKVTAATLVAAFTTIALVIASTQARYRDRRARSAGVAVVALAGFAIFKEGVVRTDAGHLSLYFSTACVLWIAVPWSRARLPWMLVGAALIAAAGIPVRPSGLPTNLNVIANVEFAAAQVRLLASGSRRTDLIDSGRESMKGVYRLDRQTRLALRGHTVAIEPWEVGVAWAYRLAWAPLPVFQNYSAYTSSLDRLNAADVESAGGAERILRENQLLVAPEFPTLDLDDRFIGWDPPAQARAVLCHFVPLHTTDRWQVLGRTQNRCEAPRFIGSIEASPGSTVRVPAPGPSDVVFVRIHGAGVSGLERLSTALLHAGLRSMIVNGTQSYRLVPDTAGDGLMLRASDSIAGSGPFSPIPQAETIELTGANEGLRYDFFRMRVSG